MKAPARLLSMFVLAMTVACGGENVSVSGAGIPSASVTQTISNGSAVRYPGIGTLIRFDAQGSPMAQCTATVIGPNTVLTAAHCLVGGANDVPGTQSFGFFEGETLPRTMAEFNLSVALVRHPDYAPSADTEQSFVTPRSELKLRPNRADIAVVHLARPLTSAPPFELSETLSPQAHDAVTLFGTGVTARYGQDGLKLRAADNTLDGVLPRHLYYLGASGSEGTTCSGDSGGPTVLFREGRQFLIGIHSEGTCQNVAKDGDDSLGIDTRMEPFVAWVKTQIDHAPEVNPLPQVDVRRAQETDGAKYDFRIQNALGLGRVSVTHGQKLLFDRAFLTRTRATELAFTVEMDLSEDPSAWVTVTDLAGSKTEFPIALETLTQDAKQVETVGCSGAGGGHGMVSIWVCIFFLLTRRSRYAFGL